MRKAVMMAGLATLALAACGQAGEKGEAKTASEPAKAAELPDGPTPGLWRITAVADGAPAGMTLPPMETCLTGSGFEPRAGQDGSDGAPDKSGMDCTTANYRLEGDAIVGSAVCTLPDGGKSESTTRISGDFTRKYTMQIDSRITMTGMPEAQQTRMTMTAERLGDCPAGSAGG